MRETATLYLLATPIGNLEDISRRALRLLSEVKPIAACAAEGIPVVPVPGPSAPVTALALSGFPALFLGLLLARKERR